MKLQTEDYGGMWPAAPVSVDCSNKPWRLMHTVALAVIVEWMESNAKGMATLEVELETALL